MTELCLMCEHYLVKCTEDDIRIKQNEIWDGFKVQFKNCPDYKRAEIKHEGEINE